MRASYRVGPCRVFVASDMTLFQKTFGSRS